MSTADRIAADHLLTLAEAAACVGLSHSHLRTLAQQGKIEAFKKGHGWLTTEAALRHYRSTEHRPGPKPRRPQRPEPHTNGQ